MNAVVSVSNYLISPRKTLSFHPARQLKTWMCILLVAFLSCENRERPSEESETLPRETDTRTSYEGMIPIDEHNNLYVELSMLPSGPLGEGTYDIREFLDSGVSRKQISSFRGKYSTLYGENPDERLIQFHNSALAEGLKRTYLTPGFRANITDSRLNVLRTEPFRTTDLTVKVSGRNKLTVLDDYLNTVTIEGDFNLVRRTSRVFTLEGYFRHNGDSADFFEMNTAETWAVSKYGEYGKAIRQYHQLATKKFEFTYMKATGFSIQHTHRDGREIEALVIKKVLQMTASPGVEID